MNFDPENKVVQLCAMGMQAEAEGKIENANSCFKQAWDAATNDFERFTAAHYCARNQTDPQINLKWNLDALKYADAIKSDGLMSYYPSLYLNLGKSYESLNDLLSAGKFYQLAFVSAVHLPDNGYGKMLKAGINEGLKRTGSSGYYHATLDSLINNWCERKELRPLSFVLPAYLLNSGTCNDINALITALSQLSAAQCLDTNDQGKINQLIAELAK